MISREERQRILKHRPATLWEGEPRLGSAHGEEWRPCAIPGR